MTEFFQRLIEVFGTDNSAEIARQLNLERQSIYRWRDGKNDPSLDTLHLITQKTGASLHWLLTGQGPKLVSQLLAPRFPSPAPLENGERKRVEELAQTISRSVDQTLRELFIEALENRGEKLTEEKINQTVMSAMAFNYEKLTKKDKEAVAPLLRALQREIDERLEKGNKE